MELLRQKEYPSNYPTDVVKILDTMTFTRGKGLTIMGTSGVRSQQYAGDYDGFELVEMSGSKETVLDSLAKRFKEMIKDLRDMKNVYIGDIKGGVVPEWRILPVEAKVERNRVIGYNAVHSRKVVDTLVSEGVITRETAGEILRKLLPNLTPLQLIELKGDLKYHIVRWTPTEILAGQKKLADGRTFTLQDAFSSPGITKLDVIGLVENNRYTDFSVIYQFRIGKMILNPELIDFQSAIQESILYYQSKGNPFKVLKRKFSLARVQKDEQALSQLGGLLNSDLGRLYLVLADIGTLITLLRDHTNVPLDKVRFQIDQFKGRLANIYTAEAYLKNEKTLLGDLNAVLKEPNQEKLASKLESIESRLMDYLEKSTEAKLKGKGLKGGATYQPFVDLAGIDSVNSKGNPKAKADALKDLEITLRDLAHYYRYRVPIVAFGYRALADDIWKQRHPPNDLSAGHMEYIKQNAMDILNKSEKIPFKDTSAIKEWSASPKLTQHGHPDFTTTTPKQQGTLKPSKVSVAVPYTFGASDVSAFKARLQQAIDNKGEMKLGVWKNLFKVGTNPELMASRLMEVAPFLEGVLKPI